MWVGRTGDIPPAPRPTLAQNRRSTKEENDVESPLSRRLAEIVAAALSEMPEPARAYWENALKVNDVTVREENDELVIRVGDFDVVRVNRLFLTKPDTGVEEWN
jgi:hypothetical protein